MCRISTLFSGKAFKESGRSRSREAQHSRAGRPVLPRQRLCRQLMPREWLTLQLKETPLHSGQRTREAGECGETENTHVSTHTPLNYTYIRWDQQSTANCEHQELNYWVERIRRGAAGVAQWSGACSSHRGHRLGLGTCMVAHNHLQLQVQSIQCSLLVLEALHPCGGALACTHTHMNTCKQNM